MGHIMGIYWIFKENFQKFFQNVYIILHFQFMRVLVQFFYTNAFKVSHLV